MRQEGIRERRGSYPGQLTPRQHELCVREGRLRGGGGVGGAVGGAVGRRHLTTLLHFALRTKSQTLSHKRCRQYTPAVLAQGFASLILEDGRHVGLWCVRYIWSPRPKSTAERKELTE